jgi:hypothetical protein
MLTKIEYVKDIWTDHAGDRSAVVIMDEGEWTKIQYQLEGDKDITVAFLPPTYAVVLTAHLDAANARIAELEAHSAARWEPVAESLEWWVGTGWEDIAVKTRDEGKLWILYGASGATDSEVDLPDNIRLCRLNLADKQQEAIVERAKQTMREDNAPHHALDAYIAAETEIYLAAGKLPRVEDELGIGVLKYLYSYQDASLSALDTYFGTENNDMTEAALLRLNRYGYLERDGDQVVTSPWTITDAGRAFVEKEGEGRDE